MSCSRVLTYLLLGFAQAGCEAGRLPTEPTSTAHVSLLPGQSSNSSAAEGIRLAERSSAPQKYGPDWPLDVAGDS